MPTRPRKPTDLPEPEARGGDEEEPIEILEVVGVDETTGAEKADRRPRPPTSGRNAEAGDLQAADLRKKLEEALAEKDKYYDLLLRKQAEFDNFRKRMEREREESGGAAVREALKGLLPVLDNIERALKASDGSTDPLFKGVDLVRQQFLDLLRKQGVEPIDALGARFDPRLHEAVEVLDVPGFEADIVLEEIEKGYTFNDRLLRPALVKVSSGRGKDPGAGTGAAGGGDRDAGEGA